MDREDKTDRFIPDAYLVPTEQADDRKQPRAGETRLKLPGDKEGVARPEK